MTCTRRLWGDHDGLECCRTDPHTPGPNTCRYVADNAPQTGDTEPYGSDQ